MIKHALSLLIMLCAACGAFADDIANEETISIDDQMELSIQNDQNADELSCEGCGGRDRDLIAGCGCKKRGQKDDLIAGCGCKKKGQADESGLLIANELPPEDEQYIEEVSDVDLIACECELLDEPSEEEEVRSPIV